MFWPRSSASASRSAEGALALRELREEVFPWGTVCVASARELNSLSLNPRASGIRADGLNYEVLKLFFLSVMWRASVASHPLFDNVRLGRYEVRDAGHATCIRPWASAPLSRADVSHSMRTTPFVMPW